MEKAQKSGVADYGFGSYVPSAEEKERFDLAMGMVEYTEKSPYPKVAVFKSFERVIKGELIEFQNDPLKFKAGFEEILKDETAKLSATA